MDKHRRKAARNGRGRIKQEYIYCSSVFINPFIDFAFKRIFGLKHNKELTIHFLNAILKGYLVIKDIRFVQNERSAMHKGIRKVIFDVSVETTDGVYAIIIEMQDEKQKFIKARGLYYSAAAIHEQLAPGSKDFDIKKTIYICITNFLIDDQHSGHTLREVLRMDNKGKEEFDDYLRAFYIELPRFDKVEEELGDNELDKWLYALKNMHRLKEVPFVLRGNSIFEKLFEVARLSNLNKAQMTKYELEDKTRRDYYAVMSYAKEEAEREGRMKGMQEGKLKGMQEGRLEGKLEGQIFIARKMFANGLDLPVIKDYTGLSMPQLKKVLKTGTDKNV